MKLRDIAHARAGDKGDMSMISVIAYNRAHYDVLVRGVTAARVTAHFSAFNPGTVRRYELASLGALNFTIENALAGGVTRSLAVDTHGKSLSSLLLELELPDELFASPQS